ncbi:MAG: hypothetical protein K0B08_00525 [Bacteroidales bacterium]|nr:hypothetical protein [Bacteroidales bacterium]
MIRSLLFSLFTAMAFGTFSQNYPADRILVSGDVKNMEGTPVSYIHVLNKTRNEGSVGDYYGRFSISVFPGDTLGISCVSFQDALVEIPSGFLLFRYHLSIILIEDTIDLKEVVIYPWPATIEKLKEEVLKLEIRDPVSENITPYLPTSTELRTLAHPVGVIISMPGPFSLIYDHYSKEARRKKAYAKALNEEKASKKYNTKIISRITGINNDNEIARFIKFCSLEIPFILNATEYQLYSAILECFNEYCEIYPDLLLH